MAGLPGLGIVTTTEADCAPAVPPLIAPPISAAAIAMDAASLVLYDQFMSGPPFIMDMACRWNVPARGVRSTIYAI
jgi:hypothetical protein